MVRPRTRRTLFAGGVLTGLMAQQLVLFAVPLILFQDTKEVSTLGIAYALEWLPNLVAFPLAGLLADRDGGVRLFRRANLARAGALGLVAVLCLVTPSWSTAVLMANGALLSILMAPVHMAVEKVVPQVAEGEDLARTQSVVQNMELLSMALGPGLAMVSVLVLGKVWLLVLAAAMFALAGACWLPLPHRAEKGEASGGSAREAVFELRLGWRLLTGNRPVLLLACFNFSINLVVSTVLAANAAVITGVFKAPDSSFALLNMCVGVMGLVNLLITPLLLRRFEVGMLGVIGFTVVCGALLLLGLASSFAVYAVAFVVMLVGDAYFNVFNRTQRVKVIPREHLGKVMGSFFIINDLSFPIGGILIATVVGTAGPQGLVVVLTVLLVVFGAVFLPLTIRGFERALAEIRGREGAVSEPHEQAGSEPREEARSEPRGEAREERPERIRQEPRTETRTDILEPQESLESLTERGSS
ncbi:MFS transporter [Streptomyces mauvecolor]